MKNILKMLNILFIMFVIVGSTILSASAESTDLTSRTVLEESEISLDFWEDIRMLEIKANELIKENPEIDEESLNAKLIEYLHSGIFNYDKSRMIITRSAVGQWYALTEKEKQLAIKYPVEAIKVNSDRKTATSITIKKFGYNRGDDNSDAFRHCAWNMLMSISMSTAAAEKWATAHESNDPNVVQLSTKMDLHNNYVGRTMSVKKEDILNANPIRPIPEMVSDKTWTLLQKGYLKKIVNNKLVPTP